MEDFEDDPLLDIGLDYHRRHLEVPAQEIFVSWGTANLLDDEIVVYTGEAHGGVLVCGSRAGLGRRPEDR